MFTKQAFDTENHKGHCGNWGGPGFGPGKIGGPWGRGRFGRFWGGQKFGRHGWGFQQVPVNIEDTDNEYVISLFAAALIKENVKLTVKDDVLKVSYEVAEPSENSTSNYTYQEFSHHSFERSFQLNNKVLTDSISATYADGILKVTLPKNPETNKPAQTITVA